MFKQLGAALSALWIGCVPSALADQVVTQAPCAFCLEFTSADAVEDFKQTLGFSAPGAGVALVTAHGSLVCTNTIALSGGPVRIDLSAQIVRDNEPADIARGPGRLSLFAQLPPNGATTFNLASTRTFEVAAAGNTDFHLRFRRGLLDPNTLGRGDP